MLQLKIYLIIRLPEGRMKKITILSKYLDSREQGLPLFEEMKKCNPGFELGGNLIQTDFMI